MFSAPMGSLDPGVGDSLHSVYQSSMKDADAIVERLRVYSQRGFGEEEQSMILTIQISTDNGLWSTEVPELPGVKASGQTRDEAIAKVQALALGALAERSKNGQTVPDVIWQWKDKEIAARVQVVQRIHALRSRLFSIYGEMPDSTPLIQEDRAR